jgi:hypothetical protein
MKARYWPCLGVKGGNCVGMDMGARLAWANVFDPGKRPLNVRYRVELSEGERGELQGLVSAGKAELREQCSMEIWIPVKACGR